MKSLIIRRVLTGDNGTAGVIVHNNEAFALSLEREWLDNATGISCIPAGDYICKRVDSPRFKDTFEVTNVKDRTHILFHAGNLDDDSHGCILVGEKFGRVKGSPGIQSSREGFNEFMEIMSNENEFRLIIADDWKNSIN